MASDQGFRIPPLIDAVLGFKQLVPGFDAPPGNTTVEDGVSQVYCGLKILLLGELDTTVDQQCVQIIDEHG